jgi:hypothetical protein
MKISLIILCAFLASCSPEVEPDCPNKLGDVNNNGIFDASDSSVILDISLGLVSPSRCQFITSDVDLDGVVTSSDVEMVFGWAMNQ